MTNSIAVIYCFPRSGGTLLNQCLLCHQDNVVLSEINPAGSVTSAEIQAADSFEILSSAEATALRNESYIAKIRAILKATHDQRKHLCIRDWTVQNFLANNTTWVGSPSMQLEQRLYLKEAGYELREIALMRRSQAIYKSIRANIPEFDKLTVLEFESAYRAYLSKIDSIKKCHLETITQDTQSSFKSVCEHLNLGFAEDFEKRFHLETKATGNNTLIRRPQSAEWTSIRPQGNPPETTDADQQKLFQELDALAGYATT